MVSADHRGRNVVLVEDEGGAQIGTEVKHGRRYANPILPTSTFSVKRRDLTSRRCNRASPMESEELARSFRWS
jgi:hypothetical protein